MEELLKQIIDRLDKVDSRFNNLETKMKSRFNSLDAGFDKLAREGQEDVKGMIRLIDKKI